MDEFIVKTAPKIVGKKNSVFKLHKDDKLAWNEAKMRRDNEYQPWQIKLGSGRAGRKFRAIKEGGVGENASYFIFYKSDESSDTYEVCPIDDWYSVTATQRYKTLTSEEAEQKFEQRHKNLNLFSVMHLKKNGEASEEGGLVNDSKAFKVSEMDDWEQSGDDFDASDEDNADCDTKKKVNKKKSIKKEKEDADDAPEEGKEDSDEGDFEQREVDYMSDSSSESSEEGEDHKDESNVKGIAEEEALRNLLDTDGEEEEETNSPLKPSKFATNKNTLGTVDIKQDPEVDGSDESSDSDDYDVDEDKMDSLFMKKSLPTQLVKQEQGGQDSTDSANINHGRPSNGPITGTVSTSRRRPATDITPSITTPTSQSASSSSQPPPKRPCPADNSLSGSQDKMIEDLLKKYLRRKPTPTRDLLKNIKSKLKRTGFITTDVDNTLVAKIAQILKSLDPIKQKINDVTYFSLRN